MPFGGAVRPSGPHPYSAYLGNYLCSTSTELWRFILWRGKKQRSCEQLMFLNLWAHNKALSKMWKESESGLLCINRLRNNLNLLNLKGTFHKFHDPNNKSSRENRTKNRSENFFFLFFGGVTSLLATSGMLPGNYLQVGLDLLKTPHVGPNAKLAKQGTLPGQLPARDPPCQLLTSGLRSAQEHMSLFSCSVVSNSFQSHELQHIKLPCPPLSLRVCSSSCPLSRWCYLIISSSVTPFSFCLQSFPASGSFPMSWPTHDVSYLLNYLIEGPNLPKYLQVGPFQSTTDIWYPKCPDTYTRPTPLNCLQVGPYLPNHSMWDLTCPTADKWDPLCHYLLGPAQELTCSTLTAQLLKWGAWLASLPTMGL